MSKLESVVIRYEKARALVSELNAKRSRLINECSGLDSIDDNHGQIVEVGVPCGVNAYAKVNEINETSTWDERCTYEDAFFNYICDNEGACPTCLEAYALKHGDLAEAKKELGNAKRSLSYHGKRLIKPTNKG